MFPPIHAASEDGLLLIGGELSPQWILEAYRRGIFPWPIEVGSRHVLGWFTPDPRGILELDKLHVSRRLARRVRSGQFRVTFDREFCSVIRACAGPRHDEDGTWISPELARAYTELHIQGFAHSVEVWQDDRLVGGLYGLALGGYFSGESMFHYERDASKVALVHLVDRLRQQGFTLFDIQVPSDHMTRMGATEISRASFLRRLQDALSTSTHF